MKERYTKYPCPICEKPVALKPGIYIAGSICNGHKVRRLEWLILQPKIIWWRLRLKLKESV